MRHREDEDDMRISGFSPQEAGEIFREAFGNMRHLYPESQGEAFLLFQDYALVGETMVTVSPDQLVDKLSTHPSWYN